MKRSGHYYSYLFRKQMQQQGFFAGAPNIRRADGQPTSAAPVLESDKKHTRVKEVAREIELDIRRTFSEDMLSSNSDWSDALRRVLIAYAMRNPTLGYCQSMNVIAGVCLMFMPEEHAFWTLTVVVEELLSGYFSKSMIGLLVDFQLFDDRLLLVWPKLGSHLAAINFNLPVVMSKWFLCLFFGALPTETALHVWDMFFLEGQRWLFGCAAACFRGAMNPRKSLSKNAKSAEPPASAFLSTPATSSRGHFTTVPLLECEDEFAAAMTVAEHVKRGQSILCTHLPVRVPVFDFFFADKRNFIFSPQRTWIRTSW
jgi:Rab-GTPase-TBC domain